MPHPAVVSTPRESRSALEDLWFWAVRFIREGWRGKARLATANKSPDLLAKVSIAYGC